MSAPLKLVAIVALFGLLTGSSLADDNFCQGCRSFVSFARQFNNSNQRTEYKELFKDYCELYYPVSTDYQQGPCPLFVEGLFYMFDHTDPVVHCDQIGACDPDSKVEQPSDDIYEYMRNSIGNTNNIKPPSYPKRRDNVVCEFCEQMVSQAKAFLKDPSFIDQAKQQLHDFCDYLGAIGQDKECRRLVDTYIDQAFDFIQHIDPKQYCASIQLCSTGKALRAAKSRQQAALDQLTHLPSLADFQNFGIETSVVIGHKLGSKYNAGPNCMLCKAVIKELFYFLRENRTEANIISGLKKVCSVIYPVGENREQCDSMVKAYTREIVQLLIDETDPEMICVLLEQCVAANEAIPFKTLSPAPISVRSLTGKEGFAELITALDGEVGYKSLKACVECKVFIEYLKREIGEAKNKEEVKNWLIKNLCMELPRTNGLNAMCKSVIENNADTLLKAVNNLLQPGRACRELGVCPFRQLVSIFNSQDSSLQSRPLLSQHRNMASEARKKISSSPPELNGQMCDQCIEVVSQIDNYLSDHPIDQDVSVIIDEVCNKLPEDSARGECTYIIKTFGDEIVQAISTMDNPRQLCSKIYLCNASKI